MLLANLVAIGATIIAVYAFVTIAERRFNVANDIARDLSGK